MMTWFKLYHDLPNNINLRKFTAQEKWAWVALLCLASSSKERGVILAEDSDVADYCEFPTTQDWLYYRDKLIAKGLVEITSLGNLKICNWEERQAQKPSDRPEAVRARVSKHRAKKKEAAVTPSNALQGVSNADVTRQTRSDLDKELDLNKTDLQNKIPPDHEQPKSQSSYGEKGSNSGDGVAKGEKKKGRKETPCKYSDEFLSWWKGYYDFCREISTETKLVSPGSKKEAFVVWQRIFSSGVSAIFFEADALYRQAKIGEFKAKGEAREISHGCRYLGNGEEDSKWRIAYDYYKNKNERKAPESSHSLTPALQRLWEKVQELGPKAGHPVEDMPKMVQPMCLVDGKTHRKDEETLTYLVERFERELNRRISA